MSPPPRPAAKSIFGASSVMSIKGHSMHRRKTQLLRANSEPSIKRTSSGHKVIYSFIPSALSLRAFASVRVLCLWGHSIDLGHQIQQPGEDGRTEKLLCSRERFEKALNSPFPFSNKKTYSFQRPPFHYTVDEDPISVEKRKDIIQTCRQGEMRSARCF